MTKEDLLIKNCPRSETYAQGNVKGIYSAMDEYAREQSIEFAEWIDSERYYQDEETKKWSTATQREKGITSEQLYSTFLQQKEQPK